MKVFKQSAIAAIAIVFLCPPLAFAANGPEPEGSWFALIFYVINFSLFIWLIRRYGGSQISEFFRNRAKAIRDNLGQAAAALQEARKLDVRARDLGAGLEAEKAQLAADIEAETAHQVGRIEDMAREAIERLHRDHELGVAALREAGQRRVRTALASATETVARDLIERDFRPADQARLLGGFVTRLDEEARA